MEAIVALIVILLVSPICLGAPQTATSGKIGVKDIFEISSKVVLNLDEVQDQTAIRSLEEIIDPEREYICSQDKANRMVSSYKSFVAGPHSSLKDFFVAFGLLTSNFCRNWMIDVFSHKAPNNPRLESDELERVNEHIEGKGLVGRIFKDPEYNNGLVLPEEFVGLYKALVEFKANNNEPFEVFSKKSSRIKRIQAICERKLSPVYEKLIKPLFTLSTMGFNYRIGTTNTDPAINRQVYKWYRATFICEILENIIVTYPGSWEPPNQKRLNGEDYIGLGEAKPFEPEKKRDYLGGIVNLNERQLKEAINEWEPPVSKASDFGMIGQRLGDTNGRSGSFKRIKSFGQHVKKHIESNNNLSTDDELAKIVDIYMAKLKN